MLEEKIKQKEKENWIRCRFAIEVMAVKEDIVEKALRDHVEKLAKVPVVFVYKKDFSNIEKVENPPKNIKEAYSQIVELELFVKDVFSLINVAVRFGPSSIEILSPSEKKIGAEEIQNIANFVTGIIHQFAAIGVGGIVMQPKK